jgi:hypothetical protein
MEAPKESRPSAGKPKDRRGLSILDLNGRLALMVLALGLALMHLAS